MSGPARPLQKDGRVQGAVDARQHAAGIGEDLCECLRGLRRHAREEQCVRWGVHRRAHHASIAVGDRRPQIRVAVWLLSRAMRAATTAARSC